ncbi:MAG: potassium transporter Kup [Candidatus Sericytochromatia bacterium]
MTEPLSPTQTLRDQHVHEPHHSKASLATLALGAIGVVYGDIGTSPLYTLKECFHGHHAIAFNSANVLGVLSLIFWSLTLVVTLKYLTFVMRADNNGEGGMFALLALLQEKAGKGMMSGKAQGMVVLAALTGASLLYGDGVITPAISVLSAVEGLEVATAAAKPFTVPLTCGILLGLFMIQKKGTGSIGRIFGPVMICWFTLLAVMGLVHIFKNPEVLKAVWPGYAVNFFQTNQMTGFLVLGSVVLCITGGEALYADMGHFGRGAIRISWFCFVFPALILNYFGQGALLLSHEAKNPFYEMVPTYLIIPLVIMATAATIIASQALISGVFSVTRQAIQMGFLNRLNIVHTSSETEGQIYIPLVNYTMMLACLLVVVLFKESSHLAAAYGVAVTTDMVLTSTLFLFVLRYCWKWSWLKALPLVILFLTFDLAYFGSNIIKFIDGGWLPALVASFMLILFLTWRDGRKELYRRINASTLPLYHDAEGDLSLIPQPGTGRLYQPRHHMRVGHVSMDFLTSDMLEDVARVPGTAVFMAVSSTHVPPVLIHHLKLNHALHEQVILLSVKSRNVPIVPADQTLEVKDLGEGVYQVTAWYGFMQSPDIPLLLDNCPAFLLEVRRENTTYFLGHQTLLMEKHRTAMARWRKALFAFMSRNAWSAAGFFKLPTERVIEVGMHIEI